MASAISSRRPALGNLAVNSVFAPLKATSLEKEPMSRKRLVDEVEEPENGTPARKVMLSPRNCVDAYSIGTNTALPVIPFSPSPTAAFDPLDPSILTATEENQSPRSIPSSIVDYDLDDTMESQQTAATEVTQPLASVQQPIAPQQRNHQSSRLELLCLRLRLAQFKVQTNQTTVPFSQLRVSMTPTSSATNQSRIISSHSPSRSSIQNELDASRDPTLPYSTLDEGLTASRLAAVRGTFCPLQDPLSSPLRKSLPPENDEDAFRTPAPPRNSGFAMAISTNEASISKDEEGLTSSVMKGNAAMGLLGLRGER